MITQRSGSGHREANRMHTFIILFAPLRKDESDENLANEGSPTIRRSDIIVKTKQS